MRSPPCLRLLISGGPGSGCTTTAAAVSAVAGLPWFDSDDFFHQPTDPPYQVQRSPEERRLLLLETLGPLNSWILSGSVATWGVDGLGITHAVLLDIGREERIRRLLKRERERFGDKIAAGGAMHREHLDFMEWAAGYESRTGTGRNLSTDRGFVAACCPDSIEISGTLAFDDACGQVLGFCDRAPRS